VSAVLQYATARAKRRDYFGMASIPLAAVGIASIYALHSGMIGGRILSGPWGWPIIIATAVCSVIAFGLASAGAIVTRGRSLYAWITVLAYLIAGFIF
jgi:hypothetical protein